jgi:hypothetical protein
MENFIVASASLAVSSLVGVYGLRAYYKYSGVLSAQEEQMAGGAIMGVSDEMPDEVVAGTPRYIFLVAQKCKSYFGTPVETAANRIAVRHFARKIMEEDGHRPTHISRDLPVVVELTFLPSDSEIWANKIRVSRAAADQRERMYPTASWLPQFLRRMPHMRSGAPPTE